MVKKATSEKKDAKTTKKVTESKTTKKKTPLATKKKNLIKKTAVVKGKTPSKKVAGKKAIVQKVAKKKDIKNEKYLKKEKKWKESSSDVDDLKEDTIPRVTRRSLSSVSERSSLNRVEEEHNRSLSAASVTKVPEVKKETSKKVVKSDTTANDKSPSKTPKKKDRKVKSEVKSGKGEEKKEPQKKPPMVIKSKTSGKKIVKKGTKQTKNTKKKVDAKKTKVRTKSKDVKKSKKEEDEKSESEDEEKTKPCKKFLKGRKPTKTMDLMVPETLPKTSRLASLNAKCKVQMMYENEKGGEEAATLLDNSSIKTNDQKTEAELNKYNKKQPVKPKFPKKAAETKGKKKESSDDSSEDDDDDKNEKIAVKKSGVKSKVMKKKTAKIKKGDKRKRPDDEILASASTEIETTRSKRVASLNASAIMAASFLPEENPTKSSLKTSAINTAVKVDNSNNKKSVSFTSPPSVESLPASPKDMQVIQRIHSSSHVEILNPVSTSGVGVVHPVVAGRVVVSQNQSIEMVKQVRKLSSSKDKASKDKTSESFQHPLLKLRDIEIPGKKTSKFNAKASSRKSSSTASKTVSCTPNKVVRTPPTDHQVSTILEKDYSVSSSQKYSTLIHSNSSHTTQSYSLSVQNATPLDQVGQQQNQGHHLPIIPLVTPAAASTFHPQQLALTAAGMQAPFATPQFPGSLVHPLALNPNCFPQFLQQQHHQQQQMFQQQQQQQNYNQQMKYHPFGVALNKNFVHPSQQQPSVVSVQSVNPFNLPIPLAHQSNSFPMTHFGTFNFGQIPVTAHQQTIHQNQPHNQMPPSFPIHQLVAPQSQGHPGQFYQHPHPPMMQDPSQLFQQQPPQQQYANNHLYHPGPPQYSYHHQQTTQPPPQAYPPPGTEYSHQSSHLNESVPTTHSLTGNSETQQPSQASLISSHQLTEDPMQLTKNAPTGGGDSNQSNHSTNNQTNTNSNNNLVRQEQQQQSHHPTILHRPKAFHPPPSSSNTSSSNTSSTSSVSSASSASSSISANNNCPVNSTPSLTKNVCSTTTSNSSVATPTISVQKQEGNHHHQSHQSQRQQPSLPSSSSVVPSHLPVPSSKVTPSKRSTNQSKTLPVAPQANLQSPVVGQTPSNQRQIPAHTTSSKSKKERTVTKQTSSSGNPSSATAAVTGKGVPTCTVDQSKNVTQKGTSVTQSKGSETQHQGQHNQNNNRFKHNLEISPPNLLQVPVAVGGLQSKTPTIATVRPQITSTALKQPGVNSPPKQPDNLASTLPLSPTVTTRRNSPTLHRRKDPVSSIPVSIMSSVTSAIIPVSTHSSSTQSVQLHVSESMALSTVSALQLSIPRNPSLSLSNSQGRAAQEQTSRPITGGHIPLLSLPSSSLSQATPLVRKPPPKRKFAHGWSTNGKGFLKHVYINGEGGSAALRTCFPSIKHNEGDVIRVGDSVLLRSGPRKTDLPFVAKISSLWEAPDGEMMMSLLWYYRPEHTEQGRSVKNMPEELFASKHRDVNSVATIDDKCYVLTFSEYCRFKKQVMMSKRGIMASESTDHIVPPLKTTYFRKNRLPSIETPSDMIFCCRRVYDFRQKRILKNPL